MRPAPRRERPVHQARCAPPRIQARGARTPLAFRPGPARRALAGLVLAFLALLGGAGSALAQSCPEPTDLWCATMTVGYVNNEEYAGYDAGGPGAVYLGLDGGTLEPDRFVHDGVEYTIDFLYNSTTDSPLTEDTSRPLALGISPALPAEARDGLVLHLDTEALALSDAVDGSEFELGLVWLETARKSLNVAVAEGLWPYFGTVAVRLAAAVTVPGAPIGLVADVEAGAVTLTWIRPSDGGAALGEYEYRVSADGGTNWSPDWSAIAGSGADTVAHEVTGLTSDTPYTFEVRAVNGQGAGPAARVDATPHAPRVPDAPGDLWAIAGAGAVTLAWTPPYSGNGPLTGYEYRVSADGGMTWSPDWSTIPGGGPGTVAHEVTRLTDDTAYTFEVRAVNGRGEGPAARTTATPSASAVAPAVTVSFGAAGYRAFEGERGLPATVEVRLSEVPGREVEVALTATGAGGATADDWNAPASVTFAATETSKTFELTAGDAPHVHDYDPGESVVLGFDDLPTAVEPGTPSEATVVLHNDEKVPVEFSLEVPDDLRISVSALMAEIAAHGARFAIANGLGAAPLGHYIQARRVAGAPSRLGNVLQRVLFPAMSERQERIERLRPVYLHGMELTSLLAMSASVPLVLCAPEIIAVLFGRQWGAAVPVLEILAAGTVFRVCNIIDVTVIRALGAVYREAWRKALFALLMVSGVWLGMRWGLAGAAVAIVAASILLHLLLTQLALDLLGSHWRRLLRCHAPALWVGAWSAGALWVATALAGRAMLPAAATLAIGLATWAAAAAAAVYAAPAFARLRSVPWLLDGLPFAELGTTGRLLRFMLQRLNPAPASRSP